MVDMKKVVIESDLYESMAIYKLLCIIASDCQIKIITNRNYNKFSVRCNEIKVAECSDSISLYVRGKLSINLPDAMSVRISGDYNFTNKPNLRRLLLD